MMTGLLLLASDDVNCGAVFGKLNNYSQVSQYEIQICKKDLFKDFTYDLTTQLAALKKNPGYCKEKFNKEVNYRRNETRVESAVCGDVFESERKKELRIKKGFSI